MLVQLPVETSIKVKESKRIIPIWLPISVAILFLLLGISLGIAGNSVIARQQTQTTPTSTTVSNPIPETKSNESVVSSTVVEKPESKSCGGFNYIVRKGDSLSLIAFRFYGDSNSWLPIIDANPELKGRESSIEIGELLIVPNLETNCTNS
jgi:LysM repeat protein